MNNLIEIEQNNQEMKQIQLVEMDAENTKIILVEEKKSNY
jgi:hypothetical protein